MRSLRFIEIVQHHAERIRENGSVPEIWLDIAACGPLIRSREFEPQLFQWPRDEEPEEHGPFFEENAKILERAKAIHANTATQV
jgi:hypothetical protein